MKAGTLDIAMFSVGHNLSLHLRSGGIPIQLKFFVAFHISIHTHPAIEQLIDDLWMQEGFFKVVFFYSSFSFTSCDIELRLGTVMAG